MDDSDDKRIFAAYPLPPKINLLEGKPRRESVIERQLNSLIGSQSPIGNDDTSNFDDVDDIGAYISAPTQLTNKQKTSSTNNQRNKQTSSRTPELLNEFLTTEAKLLKEIEALQGRPLSSPLTSWGRMPGMPDRPKSRQEPPPHPKKALGAPAGGRPLDFGRPTSRSSSRLSNKSSTSTSEELRLKEAKLLADIEDIERKEFKPQTMVLGAKINEQAQNNSTLKTSSPLLYRNSSPTSKGSKDSVYTTILTVPAREVDNKSPLPFAYDNFSTKGVHGNIASFGAVEPDNPYPPIYPIMKKPHDKK